MNSWPTRPTRCTDEKQKKQQPQQRWFEEVPPLALILPRCGGEHTVNEKSSLSPLSPRCPVLVVPERVGSGVSVLSREVDASKRWSCLEIQPKMSGLSGRWPQ